jgi:CheY-like chemotaxis protein
MRQDVPRNSGGYCIRSLKELATVAGVDFSPLSPHDAASGFTLSIPIQDARTVLVVDDNEDTLMLMQRYLEQNGYHILLARSSAEALDLARGHRPHVIMLDLMMPDRDGWDTLQILTNQSETRHIPVIVCTVLSAADLALALGASAYLEKPVTEQSLLDVLSALEAA